MIPEPRALPTAEPRAIRRSAGERAIDLGPVEAIPVGEGRAFTLAGRTVAVFRPRPDHLYALDNRCPHRAGSLADGIVVGGVVVCPLHGRKFDLASGRCVNDHVQVRAYAVILVDGRMNLLLEDRN